MKRWLLVPALLLSQLPVQAGGWSGEVQYGRYYPEAERWSDYYGSDRAPYLALNFSYRLLPFVELGVDAGRMHDHGRAVLPSSGSQTGSVDTNIYPLMAQAQVSARFAPGQWLVPYAAVGAGRIYYRQVIAGQDAAEGNTAGRLTRAGLALNMNILDSKAAAHMRSGYDISHTFLLLERQRISGKINGAELGGDATVLGLRFEF